MGEMQVYSGWIVHHPWFLKEMPAALDDMLAQVRFEATFKPVEFYDTREEALGKLKEYLTAQGEQARKDLDFLSKPYTSPNGVTYIDPPQLLAKWRAECRAKLEIAERGLEILSKAEKDHG